MRNKFPSKELVDSIRAQYPKGTRVELVSMNDPYTDLKPGDRGTVMFVDDIGTIHTRWDSGSGLGIAYGEDSVRRLAPERQGPPDQSYLCSAELDTEQNYNMAPDGLLNNIAPPKADLTDGQTHAEQRELAPQTLPEEIHAGGEKPSLLGKVEQYRADAAGTDAPAGPDIDLEREL